MIKFLKMLANRESNNENSYITVGDRSVSLKYVRSLKARRYTLRLNADGAARVTIPRRGSYSEAMRFVERNKTWLERALRRLECRPKFPREWTNGTPIHLRGEIVPIQVEANESSQLIRIGTEIIECSSAAIDLRRVIEVHLRRRAASELPPKVFELAARHELVVNRVSVRNQRSRWGSCSRRGTISLNWRLIQTPPFVQEYLILHELMHLKQMNHSKRFWREVALVCPDYKSSEKWLTEHSGLLRH